MHEYHECDYCSKEIIKPMIYPQENYENTFNRNHKLLGVEPNTLCIINTNANKKLMVEGREITDDVLKYIEELKVNIPTYTYPNSNITAKPYIINF